MNDETRRELRDYAWNYFDIHAHQRLNVFSFYITLSTATIGGFLALLEFIDEPSKWMAIIPFSLSFFSFIFWKLDKRTSMLVENGEAALKALDGMLNHPDDAEGKPNVLSIFGRRWTTWKTKRSTSILPTLAIAHAIRASRITRCRKSETSVRTRQDSRSIDLNKQPCRYPAGNAIWLKAKRARTGHHWFMQFQAYESDCARYAMRKRCLRSAQQETPREINVALGITEEQETSVIARMKRKIDSVKGRHIYSQRLGAVEPVFAHITDAIGITRFSRRGKRKVDVQWKLMMMLHNMPKIHRYGWGYG